MIQDKEHDNIYDNSLMADYIENEYLYEKQYLEIMEVVDNVNFNSSDVISSNDFHFNKHIHEKEDTILVEGFEIFNLRKICSLKEYLDDYAPKNENNKNYTWFHKVKNQVNNIVDSTKSFVIKKDQIYIKVKYETRKSKMGRLYSNNTSIQHFPREVRSFLFENFYYDFDLVNCHYSFLAFYATKKAKIEVPSILKYVTQREEILKLKTEIDNIDRSEAKHRLLVTLNSTKSHSISLGYFCHDIFLDIEKCVNCLFNEMLSNEYLFKEFQKKIDKNFYDFEIDINAPYELKVKNMIFWLHTMETKVLLSLSSFIGRKCQEDHNSFLIESRYPFNKKVVTNKYSSEVFISFVPFFDGAYVRTNNDFLNTRLSHYVKEFNDELSEKFCSFIKFDEKPVRLDNFKYLDITILKKYLALGTLFQSLTTQKFNRLLKHINQPEFSLPPETIISKSNLFEIRAIVQNYRVSLYEKFLIYSESEILAFIDKEF
jgi:hypothetical protein